MKKLFYVIAITALMATFVACEKNELETDYKKTANLSEQREFGMLEFSNRNDFLKALETKEGTRSTHKTSSSFISLLSEIPSNTRSSQEEKVTYYDMLEFDELIPNKNFAELLNPNGEIMINDTIYMINRNGTYYYPKAKIDSFKNIYKSDSLGIKVSKDLYQLAEDIYRYDTFKDLSETIEIDIENNNTETRYAPFSDFNYNRFPQFSADRHTWLGKARQGLFGNEKWYNVEFPKQKVRTKIRGRLYAYHYVVYSESGITGQSKFKNWIGWSKFNIDEIRVGWKYVVLVVNIPDLAHKRPDISTPILTGISHFYDISTHSIIVDKAFLMIPEELSNESIIENRISMFTNLAFEGLRNELRDRPRANVKFKRLILNSPTSVYEVILEDMNIEKNAKEISKVFSTNYNIMFEADLLNLPKNIIGWAKTLKGTLNQGYPRLHAGQAVICGRQGNEWRGMRIVK